MECLPFDWLVGILMGPEIGAADIARVFEGIIGIA